MKKGPQKRQKVRQNEKSGCSVPPQHPDIQWVCWSGRLDLNQRPMHPESIGIPNGYRDLHLGLNDFNVFLFLAIPHDPYLSQKV
jgi:hypothetical protein